MREKEPPVRETIHVDTFIYGFNNAATNREQMKGPQ